MESNKQKMNEYITTVEGREMESEIQAIVSDRLSCNKARVNSVIEHCTTCPENWQSFRMNKVPESHI